MRKHASIVISGLKNDRKAGMSILDLMQKYSLSKTTVWHHVHDIELSESQKNVLRSRMGGGAKRSQAQWDFARTKAKDMLSAFDEDAIWPILFAALYWSEGTKKNGFVFTNTDVLMIRVFLKILRERLGVRDADLDILIRTSTPMSSLDCRKYWSKATGIPLKLIKINHDDKQNKGKTKYGMCRITLRKGGTTLKIVHCLIQEITGKMLA